MDTPTPPPLDLALRARLLRVRLDPHYAVDTAYPGRWDPRCPVAGHCAVTALIAWTLWREAGLAVEFVSARIPEGSHWFVRVLDSTGAWDVALTTDQLGQAPVTIVPADTLHPGTRTRAAEELALDTRQRAHRLADRAGFRLTLA